VKSPVPDTRPSLILRLPDAADVEAWEEFAAIYQPLVYRLARAKGFQPADAQDIVQEVLLAVARAVARWEPDPERGRFRDWLFRIARNLMINFLTRKRHRPLASGDSGIERLLNAQCDPDPAQSAAFDLEYQREVFRWAAERIRRQMDTKKWQAFWRTSVDCRPIPEVAEELGMTTGAVYIARSRVLAMLRRDVQRFERDK
jgi:RNA polymerase sigma-70 factor (ECF subfamily)